MSSLPPSSRPDSEFGLRHSPPSGTTTSMTGAWGRYFIWLTPLVAGISCVPNLEIGGLRYTGWLWMILLVMAVALYATRRTADIAANLDGGLLPAVALQAKRLDALPGAGLTMVNAPEQPHPARVVFHDLFEPPDASRVAKLAHRVSLDRFI